MDERGRVLERLHEIRLDSILEERRHGAFRLEVGSGDGLAGVGIGNDHTTQAPLEIHKVARQAERSHHLGGHGDVEAILTRNALRLAAQAVDDVTELTVVHVHRTLPHDLLGIDTKGVTLLDMVVEHGGKEVVRRADGMEVAGEVQVDVLHGDDLRVTAASGAALHAEHRTERRLAKREHGLLAQTREGVGETDGRGGLALTRRRGVDGGHEDELGLARHIAQRMDIDLRLVLAVVIELIFGKTDLLGNLGDMPHLRFLRDLDIRLVLCHIRSPR